MIVGRTEAERHHLRIGDEVERDQVGARLLQRRVLLAQAAGQILGHRGLDQAGAVPDDLVQVGRELGGEIAPALGP